MIIKFRKISYSLADIYPRLAGFFHPLVNRSIVPFSRSLRVSSRLAVTIHSIYSFLQLKDRASNNPASFLFFFKIAARSSGRRTSFVFGSTYLNTSRSSFGLASFFRSASVFKRHPKTDQVSSNEIRLIHVNLSP